jgi:hypothetical protein
MFSMVGIFRFRTRDYEPAAVHDHVRTLRMVARVRERQYRIIDVNGQVILLCSIV